MSTVAEAPKPGTPEYDASMVALFENQGGAPEAKPAAQASEEQPKPTRPEWLPENFASPEDLAKSYREAQAELTRSKQELAALKAGKASEAAQEAPGADGAPPKGEVAKVDWQAFQAAYGESGEVSQEWAAKFEAAGIPKDALDRYIAGQQALDALFVQEVHALAGGEEQYASMVEWGKANLSDAERQAYDRILDTGSKEQVQLAVSGIMAKWKAAGGGHEFLTGDVKPALGDVYATWDDASRDMRDPRYGREAGFTKAVEAKIARSKALP